LQRARLRRVRHPAWVRAVRCTMRWASVGLLSLSACTLGSFSNKDLDFYAALPVKEDLQSKLPQTATTGQGLSQSQQGLNAGDHSDAYKQTKDASTQFNGMVEEMIGFVDAVRQFPPSKRIGDDQRIWGPFPD